MASQRVAYILNGIAHLNQAEFDELKRELADTARFKSVKEFFERVTLADSSGPFGGGCPCCGG